MNFFKLMRSNDHIKPHTLKWPARYNDQSRLSLSSHCQHASTRAKELIIYSGIQVEIWTLGNCFCYIIWTPWYLVARKYEFSRYRASKKQIMRKWYGSMKETWYFRSPNVLLLWLPLKVSLLSFPSTFSIGPNLVLFGVLLRYLNSVVWRLCYISSRNY